MASLDVQADLIRRLSDAFPNATVARHVPAKRPDLLITVRREGGRRLNGLQDAPGVGIEVWASTDYACARTADGVADFMEGLSFSDGYERVTQEAEYSDPDTASKAPRWYLSYSLVTHVPAASSKTKG